MFEYSRFLNGHKTSVVKLLQRLWKNSENECDAKFCWKHEQNPFSKGPVGVVATHNGNVVGCRFFVVQKFQMKSRMINVLSAADSIVDPEFQRQGLFGKLNLHSMVFYEKENDFFLYMSSNIYSTPAYIKQGAQPLCKKRYLRHFNPLSIFRSKQDVNRFQSKAIDNILVTTQLEQFLTYYRNSKFWMERSVNRSGIEKTEIYMNWRFRNPEYKYLYAIETNGRDLESYIILRIENHGASVIDYDGKGTNGSMQILFDHLIRVNPYGYLSVMDVSLPIELRKYLIKRKFMTINMIEKKINKLSYDMPILLRPVKTVFSDSDWVVEGNDMREIKNWRLTPVCSDAG